MLQRRRANTFTEDSLPPDRVPFVEPTLTEPESGPETSHTPGFQRGKEPMRVPAISVFFLGTIAGWFMAQWPGAIVGGLIGFFAWRARA